MFLFAVRCWFTSLVGKTCCRHVLCGRMLRVVVAVFWIALLALSINALTINGTLGICR